MSSRNSLSTALDFTPAAIETTQRPPAKSRRRRCLTWLALILVLLMGAGNGRAAVLVWTNTTGGYWADSLSWTNSATGANAVPGPSDDANIPATAPCTITITNETFANSIDFSNTFGQTLTLDLNGNNLSLYKSGTGQPTVMVLGDPNSGTSTVYLVSSAGPSTLFLTNSVADGRVTIGRSGVGTLIATNLQIVVRGQTILANSAGPLSMGKVVLSGPNTYWTNSSFFNIGNNAGGFNNSLVISNSASMTIVSTFGVGGSGSSSNSLLLDTDARLFTGGGGTVTIGNGAGIGNTAVVQGGAIWNGGNRFLTIGGTGTGNSLTVGSGGTVSNMPTCVINAGNSLILSDGVLSVSVAVTNNSGVISGFGAIAGDVIFTGTGSLTPGLANAVGTLALSNNLALVAGSTTTMKLDKDQSVSNDVIDVVSNVTEAGTLTVINVGSALVGGDTFKLFAFGSQSGHFGVTNLPSLSGQLVWDATLLGAQGVISVALAPSVTGPSDQAILRNYDAVISATVTGLPSPALQWQLGGVDVADGPTGNGSTITGSTSDTLTVLNAQVADSGQYCLIASNHAGVVTNCMTLTISSGAVPTIAGPSDQNVIAGNDATFTASVAGIPAPAVQWQENGADINGATNTTLTLTNVQSGQDGYTYSIIATNSEGSATNSAQLHIVVPPEIAVQPQSLTVTNTQSASFSVTYTNAVPPPTYQWKKNNVSIPDATNDTYIIASTSPADMGTYSVVLVNVAGSVTSSDATLTVNSTMMASLTPSNGATDVCYDTPLYMVFGQTPVSTGTGTIKIFDAADAVTPVDIIDTGAGAVQSRSIGSETFNTYPVIITNTTVAIYPHLGVLASNQTYYVTVDAATFTDTNGALFAGISDTNGWRFTTKPTGPANPNNVIVAADGSGDFCTVQGAVDSVVANNTNYTLINIRNGTYVEIVDTKKKNNLTFRGQDRHQTIVGYPNNNNLNSGTHIRMAFKVYSDDIAVENLTITNMTAKGGSQAEALMLETNIKRFILNNADVDSFQDTILGNTSGTQAYFNDSLIQGDTDFIWGAMNAFFTNCELRCLSAQSHVTQARTDAGSNGIAFVDCAVTKASGTVTNCDLGRALGYSDGNVIFMLSRIDDHITGWSDLSLRDWEFGNSNLTGTASVTYDGIQLTNGDVNVENAGSVTSWLYGWDPQLAPDIVSPPMNLTVGVGDAATFTVSATGIPDPSYQWLKDGTNLVGATSATLVIPNSQAGDIGVYSVIASNNAGIDVSANAVLTILFPPPGTSFSASPTNGEAPLVVTFTDASSGNITNRFWDFGDGQTTNTIASSLEHTYGLAGTYTISLTVSGLGGSNTDTESNYVSATNPPPPVAAFSASPTSGAAALPVTFTDASTGNVTNHLWDFGDGATTNTTDSTATHTYTTAGTYSAGLTVFGLGGSDTTNRLSYISVTADITAPELQIDTPTEYEVFTNANITVTGVASDASGIGSVTVNGSAASLAATNWSKSFLLALGTNTITVIATDGSANLNTTTQTVHAIFVRPSNSVPQIIAELAVTNALLQTGAVAVVAVDETNTLAVTATDADRDTLTYQWTFGDGQSTNTLLRIVDHVYTNDCGPYAASVTVSDGQDSTNSALTVTIACQLQVVKMRTRLYFKKSNADHCHLIGYIDLPNGYDPANKSFTLDIGGKQTSFTLNAKRRWITGTTVCRLRFNRSKQEWRVNIRLRKTDLQDSWVDEGLVDAPIPRPGNQVTMRVIVLIDHEAFVADRRMYYTAKAGKTGLAE